MFTDRIKIKIKSGDGGDGVVSFHTEKYINRGGPDGGDGGRGGDVVFLATEDRNTLNDFVYQRKYTATSGENGASNNCYGKAGVDVVIKVPVGTVIKDAETGRIMADLFKAGDSVVIQKGGRGGKGNARFANSRRQTPKFCTLGEKSEIKEVELELKTIADVGLVGFPNVGKSTLLSVISNAKPKIADYPFTTLNPNLGVVSLYHDTFIVADIPGLIENASLGEGLGHRFLQHIERTRMIVHVLDMAGYEDRDPLEDFAKINKELKEYSEVLGKLPQIVCANKMDGANAQENLQRFCEKYPDYVVIPVMAAIHENIGALLDAIYKKLKTLPKLQPLEFEPYEFEEADKTGYNVYREDDVFVVEGGLVTNLSRLILVDDYDSLRYMHRVLRTVGVIDELVRQGAKDGDTVLMGDIEFEFTE
ncbi:MAG: GTPase ObgE [Clostridia bacterium]|nr:GTPase ObgE [Clostridia bacterium]